MQAKWIKRQIVDAKGFALGLVTLCDVHGCGRENSAWIGQIGERSVEFRNLRALTEKAKAEGWRLVKVV